MDTALRESRSEAERARGSALGETGNEPSEEPKAYQQKTEGARGGDAARTANSQGLDRVSCSAARFTATINRNSTGSERGGRRGSNGSSSMGTNTAAPPWRSR